MHTMKLCADHQPVVESRREMLCARLHREKIVYELCKPLMVRSAIYAPQAWRPVKLRSNVFESVQL